MFRWGYPIARVTLKKKARTPAPEFSAGRPLIVTGLIDSWPALNTWRPDYLIEHMGTAALQVGDETLSPTALFERLQPDERETTPYLHNYYLEEHLPQLLADVAPMPPCIADNYLWHEAFPKHPLSRKGRIGLFIGGRGSAFPVLHRDNFHTNAFIFQILGTKRVWLYAPDQAPYLYVNAEVPTHSSIEAPHLLDEKRYPKFAETTPHTAILAPGEVLFVPDDWWHVTYMEELSISVSVNHVHAVNFNGFAAACREHWHQTSRLTAWLRYTRLRLAAARIR